MALGTLAVTCRTWAGIRRTAACTEAGTARRIAIPSFALAQLFRDPYPCTFCLVPSFGRCRMGVFFLYLPLAIIISAGFSIKIQRIGLPEVLNGTACLKFSASVVEDDCRKIKKGLLDEAPF